MGVDTFIQFYRAQENADKKISIALMSSIVMMTIQYFVLVFFDLFDSNRFVTIQLVSKGLVGLVYLYALPSVLKRNYKKFFIVYFIAIFMFLLHYVLFPQNSCYIIDLIFPIFFIDIPAFNYALSIRDFDVFRVVMKKASYIVFIVGGLIGALAIAGKVSIGNYSMTLSYYMLFPTILFIDSLMNKLTLSMLAFSTLSFLIILALGSRGPILCIIIFVLLKLIRPDIKITYKRIIYRLILLGMGIITFAFIERILEVLYNIFLKLGVNSRTLILLFSDSLYLSGREVIYANVIKSIVSNPFTGIGIAGDRLISNGKYVHNFFLEVISDFGIITGAIIVSILVISIARSLATKDQKVYNLTIIWICIGFVHLMISSSYLIDTNYWIFMGLITNFFLMFKNKEKWANKIPNRRINEINTKYKE